MTETERTSSTTTVPSATSPAEIAERYFDAWQTGDFEALRALLADDVSFVGALGTADGAEACLAGLRGMSTILERIEVKARVADADDVITWFDLHTTDAPPTPTANWTHVEDGRITAIRVTFDPRGILGAGTP
ncbi:nuclear transport factor 2 family protein (plasmid) [Streptomyces sp. BI20]|uniref:nuclear transport factor 2 family protein n=1 Tax=Streptomyces sp. BI20 TaxID=3403460 RepID=UPI003C75CCB8